MKLFILIPLVGLVTTAQASIILYGICQTACNAGLVTCVTAAGLTMGPAALVALPQSCLVQGACMAACATLLAVPVP